MTDASDTLTIVAPRKDALLLVEIWGDLIGAGARLTPLLAALPAPGRAAANGGLRTLWWEPRTWLLRAAAADRNSVEAALVVALGPDGAITDVSGSFARLRIQGGRWRDLLMIGGVFDAEAPGFGPGCVAGTVIHHLPVRLDVVAADVVDAYVPPSYAPDLEHHWAAAQSRLRSAG